MQGHGIAMTLPNVDYGCSLIHNPEVKLPLAQLNQTEAQTVQTVATLAQLFIASNSLFNLVIFR